MLIPVSIDLDFMIRKRNDTVYLDTNFTGNGKYFTVGLTKIYSSSTTDLETNEHKIFVFDENLMVTFLVKPQYREIFKNNDILSSTVSLTKDDEKYIAKSRIFINEEYFILLKLMDDND